MSDKDKIASIPEPPKNADPSLRGFLTAIKEVLEVRLGRRGDPMEEGITKRELVESGIAKLRLNPRGVPQLEPVAVEQPGKSITPPVPAGASAVGVYGGIALGWDSPFNQYNVHAFVEIWRSDQPDPTTRVLLDSSRGTSYFDRIHEKGERTYYYWLCSVSEFGRRGPMSEMLTATKPADVDEVLDDLNGRIDLSMLNEVFQSDYQGVKNAVSSTTQTLASVSSTVSSQAQQLSNLSGTVNGQAQQITNLSASITQQAAITSSYAASWSLMLNSNGYVSGLASYNNGTKSEFAIVADVFWLATSANTKVRPFIVEGGTVYMNAAVIKDASITSAKIANVSFGKIVDGSGNPVMQVSGKLRADLIDVGNIQIGNGNISGVIQSNALGSNGQPRWVLDKNGGLSLNSVGGSGRMEVRDSVIKCYDSSGRLRVHIGNLQA